MYDSFAKLEEAAMLRVSISELRANLNQFLEKTQNGEVVSVTKRGNEVARLVAPDFAQQIDRAELKKLRKTAYIGDGLTPIHHEVLGPADPS